MPATIATNVPASKACCMNWYCNICCRSTNKLASKAMLFVPVVDLNAYYRDVSSRISDNFYLSVVESAKAVRCQDIFGLTGCHFTIRHVNYFIKIGQERVDVMSHK